jgi:hypothetical protein
LVKNVIRIKIIILENSKKDNAMAEECSCIPMRKNGYLAILKEEICLMLYKLQLGKKEKEYKLH